MPRLRDNGAGYPPTPAPGPALREEARARRRGARHAARDPVGAAERARDAARQQPVVEDRPLFGNDVSGVNQSFWGGFRPPFLPP